MAKKYPECAKCHFKPYNVAIFPCKDCRGYKPLTCYDCRFHISQFGSCQKKGVKTCKKFEWW